MRLPKIQNRYLLVFKAALRERLFVFFEIMKKIAFIMFAISLIFNSSGTVCAASGKNYVPGEIIIKLKGDLPLQSGSSVFSAGSAEQKSLKELLPELRPYSISNVENIFQNKKDIQAHASSTSTINVYRISISDDAGIGSIVKTLGENSNVSYAHLNHYVKFCLTPNDPYADSAAGWGIYKIQADKAWDYSTGNEEVVIAVIDTGIDYTHEELSGRVIKGYDFSDRDDDPMDEDGHGTHVAGIIAAAGNNSKGMAGMVWNSKILAIKVYPYGTEADCAAAIRYATDHVSGVDIINMSWCLYDTSYSPVLNDAIEYASANGVVLVAAAGNDYGDVADCTPANHGKVIAVTSTDKDDKRCSFANRGDRVDVAAPGGGMGTLDSTYNILSLGSSHISEEYDPFAVGGDYLRLGGTSMAASYVSGLAALILSKNPNLSKGEVESIIKFSTDDLGDPGFDNEYGYGRINVLKALTMTPASQGDVAEGPGGGEENAEEAIVEPPDWVRNLKVGDMVIDKDNNMYVIYTNQSRIVKYCLSSSGNMESSSAVSSTNTFGGSLLHYPMGIAVSSAGDRVFVADTFKNRVLVYDQDLNPLSEMKGMGVVTYYKYVKTHKENWWGLNKYSYHTHTFPVQVAIEGYDCPSDLIVMGDLLYVADKGKKRVLKYKIGSDHLDPEPFDVVLDDLFVNLSEEDRIKLQKLAELQPDAALVKMGGEVSKWFSGAEFLASTGVMKGGLDIWAALASPLAWTYLAVSAVLFGLVEETKFDGEYHRASSIKLDNNLPLMDGEALLVLKP